MPITPSPSENGGGPPPAAYGAKFGRDAVPSLLVAVDEIDGRPYPIRMDQATGGLLVQDDTVASLLTTIAGGPSVIPPQHIRCFQCTPNGVTTGALLIVPSSLDGQGKEVTNASVQGGADGVDVYVGPQLVTNLTGTYLGPGSTKSFKGREALYVYATAPGGLVTAAEEY